MTKNKIKEDTFGYDALEYLCKSQCKHLRKYFSIDNESSHSFVINQINILFICCLIKIL